MICTRTHTHKETHDTKQRAFVYCSLVVCKYTNIRFLGKCLDVLRSKASYAYASTRGFPSKYLLPESLCFESAFRHACRRKLGINCNEERHTIAPCFELSITVKKKKKNTQSNRERWIYIEYISCKCTKILLRQANQYFKIVTINPIVDRTQWFKGYKLKMR